MIGETEVIVFVRKEIYGIAIARHQDNPDSKARHPDEIVRNRGSQSLQLCCKRFRSRISRGWR
jgi:hypothetical protein